MKKLLTVAITLLCMATWTAFAMGNINPANANGSVNMANSIFVSPPAQNCNIEAMAMVTNTDNAATTAAQEAVVSEQQTTTANAGAPTGTENEFALKKAMETAATARNAPEGNVIKPQTLNNTTA